MSKAIKAPAVVWSLGDAEPSEDAELIRPLYYRPKGAARAVKVGAIDPEYAEPLMKALAKAK